jgi:splicing factor U2AF subunit
MHVCDNVGDHLIGNVYARYEWEDEAQSAVEALNERWYSGRPLFVELSPVTDFREACCRQNDMGECNRGGFCNFMHLREPPTEMVKELHQQQRVQRKLFPSERDIERKKEMAMFEQQFGSKAGDRDNERR